MSLAIQNSETKQENICQSSSDQGSSTNKSQEIILTTTTTNTIKDLKPIDPKYETEQLAKELGINHKKLMWKIDICVVPPFCLLYFFAFLDRVNISNAKLYGLSEDLNLTGTQYNTALTLFFVPYILFEVLGNYAIKYVKPHIWLSGSVFFFGAITVGMGFAKDFSALAATRFLLGIAESALFCGVFYLLATYYSKAEAQKRFSAFFSCTALSGAASGAIAYRVVEMDGLHGISAWRWIFILEGCATVIGSFFLFFMIADFPEESRFLNAKERTFLKKKLEWYSGTSSAYELKNTFKDVGECLKDWLIWLPALSYFGLIIPSYGYAYFAASIIKEMGYTAVVAQQYSAYPWVAAFVVINITAICSDFVKKRLPFFLGSCLVAIAGLSMVLAAKDFPQVRYGGCFLAASGLYTAMPTLVCWAALNNGSHIRKSVGTAWQIGIGNIGGIIATFIFLAKDEPYYVPGLSTCIGGVCFAMITGVVYFILCWRLNKVKQTDSYKEKFNAKTERDQINLGDRNPAFEYLY
ncbi:TNA1 [Candida oxycetoniae]|uniref:TNA1 n=1 Tax=Candida oxycetoniae TaxID=497107 RepID=A0AAI9SVR3_9ASCO|nr:TNA1 [Candida oxycetoniae]KAI3403586.1 TNA1 [Candida oxycetoniae]